MLEILMVNAPAKISLLCESQLCFGDFFAFSVSFYNNNKVELAKKVDI